MKLCKESFSHDGQQFHQYQQNKQSPLTLKITISSIVDHHCLHKASECQHKIEEHV
jgi:hypothetical protein